MGIVKYEKLGIEYPLKDTPMMDKKRIPALREAIMRGLRSGRAAERTCKA